MRGHISTYVYPEYVAVFYGSPMGRKYREVHITPERDGGYRIMEHSPDWSKETFDSARKWAVEFIERLTGQWGVV